MQNTPPSRRIGRRLIGWAILLVLGFVAIGVAQDPSRITEDKNTRSIDELLLFFPSKYPQGDWNPKTLEFQDVTFASADSTPLHAWYCPAEQPRGYILVAHGNAGHLADRADWTEYLQTRLQCSVFIFDYRGYGRSGGKPTVRGALDDARAAIKEFSKVAGVPTSEITLMGESLGGAIVVQLAAETKPKALILQSTFSSLRDVARHHYAALAWMVPAGKLDSVTAISKYRGPLLISHGTKDRVIPFELGEQLYAAANDPKQFYAVMGADHNDAVTSDYLKALDGFIKTVGKPIK